MYSLRYWYEKKHKDGKVIRLEIHKKNNSAAAMEIGDVVQELSLNIDGGEDNIDAPIVSTSLVMTFVDAYDHKDAKAKKCGNWAEFYTPDATLWKVVLLCKDAGASAFRTLWGGYVTPDSYEEDLTYRGSVTIVARDNIGHLADFPFDATGDDYGTISLRELLAEAWVKIESPMALRAYDDWMQTEGVSALDTRLNVSAFKDKSWHEAIEAALYAYGAAMRFVGDNEVMVSPLRYVANFGGSFTQSQPIFMAGATRMLTPAVKRIEETASYDLEAELQPLVKVSDFSGERTALDSENDIYGYYLSNTEEGKGWLSSDYHTIFFDPSGYGIQEADSVENLKNQMYVVADEDYAYTAEYSRYVLAQSAKVKVTFGTGFMRKRYMGTNGLPTGGYYLVPRTGTITKAYFIISVTQNGVKQYLKPNGEWAATPTAFSKANDSGLTEIEHDIDLSDFTGTILLKIEIGGIVATIPYVGISAFSIGTNEAVSLLQTNRVNTNYNEENNVIIKRDPVIAPAYNTTILPSIIKNGIFYLDGVTYKPAKAWAWTGGTPQQMAVYNHLQLLTFYAKPNNVIEGNIVNGDVSRFAHIWQFEGKEHILVSGRYNYISGFIEGAILREFVRYESLWGSTGEAQLPATETSEETNKESSASSSSAASTYDNTTLVNIGSGGGGGATNLNDLQDVDVTASVAESVLYFNGTNWVDKTIQSLLAELRAIGDWFYKTDDGKSIGTKFNFFSEQEVSANGLSTGSNGGGGLISQVFGKSAFGTIATESNAATFNAYAIDSLYKRIVSLENKEVDLTGYATESWVAGQGFITSAALSPYMKTADANDTFATKTALNNLSSSHDSLAARVSTAEGNISTNAKGIADNKTAIATNKSNISANATAITNLGKRVTANEGNIAKILKWFAVDSDGNLYTTYNFYSTKEISANGLSIGSGGSGGGLISQVYGITAFGTIAAESNSATFNAYAIDSLYKRIVSLEGKATAVSFVPALTSGKQIGTLSIDGVSTVLYGVDAYSKADADSTFLKLSGGKVTGVVRIDTANSDIFFGIRQSGSDKSAFGWSTTDGTYMYSYKSSRVLGIKDDGTPFFGTTSAHYTLLHSGNYYDYALPLTGGTISGNTYIPLKVVGTSVRTSIGFSKDASAFAYLTYNGGSSWAVTNEYYNNEYTLYHTGNFNPANYLPLTGGSIVSSTNGCPLSLANTKETWNAIGFKGNSHSDYAYFGLGNNGNFFVTTTGWTAAYSLIHSGNIGEYKAGDSDKLGGVSEAEYARYSTNIYTTYHRYIGYGTTTGGFPQNGGAVVAGIANYSMLLHGRNGVFRFNTMENGSLTGWKTVAFTDSNVASATKLATARTIWGQSFDGSGNVDGDFTQSINAYGTSPTISHKVQGSMADRYCALRFRFNAYDHFARLDIESNKGVLATINSSGNVTIGSSDLAGTGAYAKLCIDGVLAMMSGTSRKGVLGFSEGDLHLGYSDVSTYNTYISGKSVILNSGSGNVGIGTTSPKHKLEVTGDIASSGSLRMGLNSAYGAYLQTNEEGWTGIYSANKGNWQATNMYLMPDGDVRFAHAARVVGKNTNGDTGLFVEGTQYSMWFGIGSGNVNRGIFDINNNGWWIYRGSDTLTRISGGIETSTGSFTGAVTMSSTLSVTEKVTAKYLSVSYDGLRFSDNANYALFMDSSNKVNLSGYYGINLNGAVSVSKALSVTGLLTANSGIKVYSGQALTFLDVSGKEHKLTYDSTAGAFKFDGNILVLGDGQFNAIN